jgi:2-oxoglutarate ferredoxin oxidoreductase subunit gamma
VKKAEVLLAGLGGQGVQLAGDILARSCTMEGKSVSVLPSYGAEARGSLIRSEVVISDQEITYPGVLEPDLFVAFSQEAYDHFLPTLPPRTGIVYDPASVTPAASEGRAAKQHPIPAMQSARALGNEKAGNMVMLGALAALSELISRDALQKIIAQGPSARRQLSSDAVDKGFELASHQLEPQVVIGRHPPAS